MNSKLTFKKTPLALAIAGLALSMGVQADSPFQFGRWAGGGNGSSSGPGGCTEDVGDRAGIAAGACNQDETNVQRTLTSTSSGLNMVMYAAFNADGVGEGGEGGFTGVGTMDLDAPDGFEGDGTASFSLNPDDFDGEGDGNYSGLAGFGGSEFYTDNENGYAEGGQLTGSTTSFSGEFALDGITDGGEGFGFFVAGVPTTSGDLAALAAEDVMGYYEGYSSPFTDYYVTIDVNFADGSWEGDWEYGSADIEYFSADGDVIGANFNADFISVGEGIEADPGSFIEGTFFGPGADALGGHFEVSAYGGNVVVSDVFFATLCDGVCVSEPEPN